MEKSRRPLSSLLAFMADLHHEIRSPVNTILNMTELALKKEELSSSIEHYFRTIERSANALLTILDDVIELSQDDFESSYKEQGFGLTDLLEDLKETIEGPRAAKGTEVAVIVGDDTPEWLSGPRGRMRQVLTQVFNFCMRQLSAQLIELNINFNETVQGNSLEFTISAHGVDRPSDDLKSILRNPRILICQRLLLELDNELRITSDQEAVEFNFAMNVQPLDKPWGLPIFPTPVSCIIGDKGFATALISRRLYGCGFQVMHAESIGHAYEILTKSAKESQKTIVLADWQVMKGIATEDPLAEVKDSRHPILYFDIPALKMMELSAELTSDEEKGHAIGLVMAPSKGRQVLSEVLRLLRMEPDQLSCPIFQDIEEDEEIEYSPEELQGLKVLVVEDDRINQKIVVEILKKFGVKPVVASTGKAAMMAVKKYRFDAIFMDINLPDTDGYRLTEEIRGVAEYEGVPVIALTASTKNRKLCMEAGMNYFLSKPYSEAKLLKSLLYTKKTP